MPSPMGPFVFGPCLTAWGRMLQMASLPTPFHSLLSLLDWECLPVTVDLEFSAVLEMLRLSDSSAWTDRTLHHRCYEPFGPRR